MGETEKYQGLTRYNRLSKNIILSLFAKVLPLFIGLFAIPVLISALGEARFGVLALIWVVISYLSMFNLGMSPALVRLISDKIAKQEYTEINKVVWTGVIFISIMGIFAGLVSFGLSNWLVYKVFEIENELKEEAYKALVYTSCAIPFIISASGFRAVMESLQKFNAISFIQGINSFLNYLLPLVIVLYLKNSIEWVVLGLLAVKILVFIFLMVMALNTETSLKKGIHFELGYLKEMIGFGKWVTVSSILGPLMAQLDRYFIGAFLSVKAVTFYSAPLEVLSKTMIIPSAVVAVLFPAFSTLSESSVSRRDKLFLQSNRAVLILLFPILLIVSATAPFGIKAWLGESFVTQSTFVAHVFCIIYFIRGGSYVPSSFLHGVNRPDLTAKFHLLEVVLFILALKYVSGFGTINHIALVALGITAIDTLLLIWGVLSQVENKKDYFTKIVIPMGIGALLISLPLFVSGNRLIITVIASIALLLVINFSFIRKLLNKSLSLES